MSEHQPEVPEAAAMVLAQITLTRCIDTDGDDAIVIKGVDGMTLMEALGILEFAKAFIIENFKVAGSG